MAGATDVPGGSYRLFSARDFRLWWTGRLASTTGTWLQLAAVSTSLAVATENAVLSVAAVVATFAPVAVAGPVGGALADRYDRRRVAVGLYAAQAACGVALAALLFVVGLSAWLLFPVLVAQSFVGGLGAPAANAFLRELVPARQVARAVGAAGVVWDVGRVVGPLAGGFLLAGSPSAAAAGNAAGAAVFAAALAAIRGRFPPVVPVRAKVWGAVGVVLGSPRLKVALGATLLLVALATPFMGLVPVYSSYLASGQGVSAAQATGLMMAVQGTAAAAAAAAMAVRSPHKIGRTVWVAGAATGALYALWGAEVSLLWAVLIVAPLAAALKVAETSTLVMVYQGTAPGVLGRVLGLRQSLVDVTYSVALSVQALAVARVSAPAAFAAFGTLTVLSMLLLAPALARSDRATRAQSSS